MPHLRVLAALLYLLSHTAGAAAHWVCGLSDDLTRLVCVADPDVPMAAAPATATAVVNGTRFPLDAARVYTVEMWGPPTEMAFVERLARATLCYRSPGCQVTVAAPALEVALAAATRRR
jgi:hypothetical protein